MSWKDTLKGLLDNKTKKGAASRPKANKLDSKTGASSKKSSGIDTQFKGVAPDCEHKQLIIGLDFGTAFTKAVFGEERIRYAVPLNGTGNTIDEYLLPSAFWINSDGACSIDNRSGCHITNLKMPIIEGKFTNDALANATVYIALVMRRIRSFVFNEKHGVYGANYIDWLINVGLPTDSYHDKPLTSVYRKLINAAWQASATPGDITIKQIVALLKERKDQSGNERILHNDAISVFPEFVAQIAGYVRSTLRKPDLHLLIDVGAGTLDATIFNVHEQDDEDKFPIFARDVKPLGTRFLVRSRLRGTELKEAGELDPFSPIPAKKLFAKLLGITDKQLTAKDKPFRLRAVKTVRSLLAYTKKRRYPLSKHWEKGVPTFLCGGGANSDFYQDCYMSEGSISGIRINEVKLPKPDMLDAPGIGAEDYSRVSVAYGLSFDPFDIGEIIPEDEIEDIPDSENIDHNGINQTSSISCTKCNGTGGLHMPCNLCGGSGFSS